jgi:SpoIID/LytB domain protein
LEVGVADSIKRSALVIAMLMAAVFVPATQSTFAATDTLELAPTADAAVRSAYPTTNYATATALRARLAKGESFLLFNLSAWQGLHVADLRLSLAAVSGDATPLRLSTTGTTWTETTVNWNNRPAAVAAVAGGPTISGTTATFDVKSLFPSGVIDRVQLSLRVASPLDVLVTFGSRETSTAKPTLSLDVASRTDTVDLPATADTYANSNYTTTNFGTRTLVKVNVSPKKESYLQFDLSAWVGRPYTSLQLRLNVSAGSPPAVSVYKIGTGWTELGLTWANRPTGGTLLTTVNTSIATGTASIDLSSAFTSRTVETSLLSLRLVGSGSAYFAASTREGGTAPVVRLAPGSTVAPPPSPSPTPTASPAPTATAAPTPTAAPATTFYFTGRGTDHGVGMSQWGARGRGIAGQKYDQILAAYYAGSTLGPLPPEKQTIRVLLSSAFVPTATEPARVIGKGGAWQSAAFPDAVFPADSYLDMDPGANGTWTANVHDGLTGTVLASAPATDLTMTPTDATTLFYMKFRDSLRKYDLYRGSMRLRVNGSGIQSINIVGMDNYVQGVVPGEMVPSWNLESLKVQAVAARSYGAARIKTTGYYDVVPTSANQLYGGVNIEYLKTNTATQATAGIVAWYADKIANTYFFDTGGGATEASEYAWPSSSGTPGTAIPYLRGGPDVDANGVAYDINSSYYSWSSAQFSMGTLSNIYAKDSRTNVGTIVSLTFYRGVSGRIYKVVMVGKSSTKTVSGAIFKNVYNSYRVSGASLKSTMIYLTPVSP